MLSRRVTAIVLAGVLACGVAVLLLRDRGPAPRRDPGREGLHVGAPAHRHGETGSSSRDLGHDGLKPEEAFQRARPVGTQVMSGWVRDLRGKPVSQQRVECQPAGLRFQVPSEHEWFTTTTSADGAFRLDGLPDAPGYSVIAVGHGMYGMAWVPTANLRQPAEITVHAVSYERFAFVDDLGMPVSVVSQPLHIVRGTMLYHSHIVAEVETLRRMAHLGVNADDLRIADNEMLVFYRETGVLKREFPVEVPGYKQVMVPLKRRPLQQWPDADQIVLPRSEVSAGTVYRIEFPVLKWPRDWGDQDAQMDVLLRVTRPGDTNVLLITRKLNEFVGDEANFDVAQEGFGPLQVEIHREGTRLLVKPEWPRFAFVEIRYDPPPHRDPAATLVFSVKGTFPPVRGRPYGRGVVRFGPLPVGEYAFMRAWGDAEAKDDPSHHMGPVELREGYNELAWDG